MERSGSSDLHLLLELPSFTHSVLYQPPPPSILPPVQLDRKTPDGLSVLQDPEMGRENPAELKAQKLARSMARGIADK